MAALMDPLRNTLDHLALDPKAKEDRRYLVSMLRRLGYSDREIEAVLGWEGDGPRVIEVEYEPPGTQPGPGGFTVIDGWEPQDLTRPGTSVGFSVARDAGDAARAHGWVDADDPAVVHGWIPDTVEFREQGADQGEAASQAWPAWPDQEATEAQADDAWEDVPSQEWQAPESEEAPLEEPWPEAPAETAWQEMPAETAWQEMPAETEWQEDPAGADWHAPPASKWQEAPVDLQEAPAKAWPEPAWEDGEAPPTEATGEWQVVEEDEPWPEADWSQDAGAQDAASDAAQDDSQTWSSDESWETSWDEEGRDAATWAGDLAKVDQPLAMSDDYAIKDAPAGAWQPSWDDAAAPFTYEGYTLHTRMVELSTGQEQRIFFFAKNAPKSGEPCPLPPGYIVETNDRTGLPFLRRDPDAEAVDLSQWSPVPGDEPVAEPGGETVEEFCLAMTKAGNQCRRAPREGSKYCATHKGWRGPRAT